VAAIGDFMAAHLAEDFDVPASKLVTLRNGLSPAALEPPRGDEDAGSAAKDIVDAVAGDAPVIFATGRAEAYKGFRELVEAFAATQDRHDATLLLALSTLTKQVPSIDSVRAAIAQTNARAHLVEGFLSHSELRAIIRSPRVRVFVVPSLAEPFSIMPIEVRSWASRPGPVIVCSGVDGFSEVVRDGIDGFLGDVRDSEAFGRLLLRALSIDDDRRTELLAAGQRQMMERFQYANNIAACIRSVLSHPAT
jgi:glycosyltransferase involved in cell wall biosynthesis